MNTPPFNITSKILNLVGQISETVALLDDDKVSKLSHILKKENRIKTITGTLEIEGKKVL